MDGKRKLFGTDGVRGTANVHPMTGEVAMAIGRALTHVARRSHGRRSPRIVIGKDTRRSGYMLETAIASGICSMGGDVLLVGPLPTPGISFITASMRADAGVVISASHNPYNDNGIKLFWADGYKLPDEMELELERIIEDCGGWAEDAPAGAGVGRAFRVDDAVGRYIVELKHSYPRHLTMDGVSLVLDCANGAAYKTAPAVFEELGAKVEAFGIHPDGININENCGALFPEKAVERVLGGDAQLGITLDGDADRLILVDEKGQIVDGDVVMALCAGQMIQEGILVNKTVVTTVMSNLGLDRAISRMGGRVVRTQVGDRYVVEEMRRNGYNFGGEQSGHLIFTDHSTTGDGVLAALQIISIMMREERSLSELAVGIMERVPQTLDSFQVGRRFPLSELPAVTRVISQVESELGEEGRVLVRFSGTEAKVRVLIEGPYSDRNQEYCSRIRETLIRELATT